MSTINQRIALVCSRYAGNGKALAVMAELEAQLTDGHIPFSTFIDTWPLGFDDYTDVFICGGDGTLNYFINQYPNLQLPLVIFKGGTGNDFAWKLYGDIPVKEQLQQALAATPKAVDAGQCNGRYFINGVGIGFDGEVVLAREDNHLAKGRHGSYIWTVLKKVLFFREKAMQLEYDGAIEKSRFFMISIANGSRYGDGFMVVPQAIVTDGLLDVVTIGKVHWLTRFYYLLKVKKGLHLKYPFVASHRVKKIAVVADRLTAAHLDGELIQGHRFDIEVLPGRFLFRY
jgi:YegS/Rv2252/BmrU family lipid kinase